MRFTIATLFTFLILSANVDSVENDDAIQAELDQIYALLTMAVVYKDWQRDKGRGHNIGAVLVDPAGKPVFWARNSRYITNNGSQHGEVRLIHNYLSCSKDVQFLDDKQTAYRSEYPEKGFTLYTTLEPCVMCTGMMTMTRLWRAVYVQSDPNYGDVMDRLQHQGEDHGARAPYPRKFAMQQVAMQEAAALDEGYLSWPSEQGGIVDYLRSPGAERVYASAEQRLRQLRASPENHSAATDAIRFLDLIVDAEYQEDPGKECP
jgi:tRNA(Arg) A34 adenosine deaminase TadA